MEERPQTFVASRAAELRAKLRAGILQRYPALSLRVYDPSALSLGRDERGANVAVPANVRLQHCHIVGATGSGKTKLIEHKFRQDILNNHGTCLIDPHGSHPDSCYRSILSWIERKGLSQSRTIHIIDPNAGSHVTGFNPLMLPDPEYDPAVIADAVLEAIERLWGEERTDGKPTLQRVLTAAVTALCELGLTLNELRFLFDDAYDEHGVRAWLIDQLRNEVARGELRWLDGITREPRGRAEFRLEVTGPRNRFAKILHLDSLALMVGQQERGLDFRAALDDGHVILANLSPGPRLSDKAAQMLGRLLLRMLFFHAQRRHNTGRPFFLYADEAHLFLSGDVARLLSEIRKYGVGCVLSHQYLAQLEQVGLDLLDALKSNCNIKVIFRSRDPEQAAALAEMVVPFDLERPVETLVKPAVVGHRIRRLHGETQSEQLATTLSRGTTHAQGRTIGLSHSRMSTQSRSLNQGYSIGQGESWSDGRSLSRGSSAGSGDATTDSSGTAAGTSETENYAPPPESLLGKGEPELRGTSKGKSDQSSSSKARTHTSSLSKNQSRTASSSRAASWSVGRSFSRSRGWSESAGRTDSISRMTSESSSVSVGRTSGTTSGSSLQEALEPIYRDLPSAVHSIENVRYLAARAVRNLATGQAIVSYVDENGLQTSFLRVPPIESCAFPPELFEKLRTQVLDASPSASPTEEARAHIARRAERLLAAARERPVSADDAPRSYRIKKSRSPKAVKSSGLHGQRNATLRSPRQGRPTAVASGDQDP
jgi:Type IV secretion-system coupling protein DNA-binding domain